MKLYKSKKIVRAFRITHIEGNELIGKTITLLTFRYLASDEWIAKNKPEVDNYVVTYENGYTSYNIQAVFDAEHVMMRPDADELIASSIDQERGWLYQSNKIVCAARLCAWTSADTTAERPFLVTDTHFTYYPVPAVWERLKVSLAEGIKPIDRMLVIYSNGYVSISPDDEFAKGYDPLTV